MKTSTFDFEEKRLREEIVKRGAKRILIQLPEGLKKEGPRLATIVENAGALAVVSADPCYGACNLATPEARSLEADLIIHYGHTKMVEQKQVPTVYIEARARTNARVSVKKALEKTIPLLKHWNNIGLTTTVQHAGALNEAKNLLLKAGKKVAIGDAGNLKYAGQVTGCDYTNAESLSNRVEAFLFIGGGRFHAIGTALATAKPTIVADPFEKRAYSIEKEVQKIIRQRWISVQEAERAEKFGVLVGLEIGQKRFDVALEIKEKLEKKGRKATLLAAREITPQMLMQFPNMEAFVNTACPRISLDEASKFHKPVLTFKEALVALGEMSWEELCRKGWFGN